ncbi:Panacea domain-containing protein [Duganella sp. Leaf61]|uniref:Panacea domain-containing protein n=1 Tax=Duganella sp. Leaf61 TaxID=1736227 RepID=UPI0009EB051D|nr:Panacea domain-containing protein [Duganella sp. Leaf61]
MTELNRRNYNETKAAEVTFYFLKRAKERRGHVTKLRLMKWLYLAERAAYANFGEPLTGDLLCSMEHGPVLSSTLYLVEKPSLQRRSNGAFSAVVSAVRENNKHQYLTIREDCPYRSVDDLRQLSDAEVGLLDSVWEEFGGMSSKQLESYLHHPDHTPEWQWSRGDGSNPIELEDLFLALGNSEEQAKQLVESIKAFESINLALS